MAHSNDPTSEASALRASTILSRVLSKEDTALSSAAILLSKEGNRFLARGWSITSMSDKIKTVCGLAGTYRL